MRRVHSPPSRRDFLRAGALGAAGLALPQLLRANETRAGKSGPLADSCILVFCWGAPSQYETFDPKPEAPEGIRGEFGVRSTRLRGVIFVDLSLAQIAALGATIALLLPISGGDPHSGIVYWISLGFTFIGAGVFSTIRVRRARIPQEAIIGICYAVASAAASR